MEDYETIKDQVSTLPFSFPCSLSLSFLELCVSSLCRGHANLLCIVSILSYVLEGTCSLSLSLSLSIVLALAHSLIVFSLSLSFSLSLFDSITLTTKYVG